MDSICAILYDPHAISFFIHRSALCSINSHVYYLMWFLDRIVSPSLYPCIYFILVGIRLPLTVDFPDKEIFNLLKQ